MNPEQTYEALRPTNRVPIYEVALAAGLRGTPWEFNEDGKSVNPLKNTFQNSLWTFGGGDEPYLASIWWKQIDIEGGNLVHRGNFRAEAHEMGRIKTDMKIAGIRDTKLTRKINKANDYATLITDAHDNHQPVRIAIVDGHVTRAATAANDSSDVEFRELDPLPWWVHDFHREGAYMLVRGIEPLPPTKPDPFGGAGEPGTEDDFIEWLNKAPLSDTEKDALVKIRVGQGYFREALITRWGGCAINRCKKQSLLIASHIKPWSKCTTRAERLSPDNGILLSPLYDKLFDVGLISFNDNFKIMLHVDLDNQTKNTLPVGDSHYLNNAHSGAYVGMKPFLKWHRQFHGFEPSP